MIQTILSILQENGALSVDKKPMSPNKYDLTGGVPIIDIPRKKGVESDFIIYDNATSPDGRTLIQGPGNVYYGRVRGGLEFEIKKVYYDLSFGVIGIYPNDYYLANRDFVSGLGKNKNNIIYSRKK